jgi:hypothetical protein
MEGYFRRARTMVNPGKVNAPASHCFPPHFRGFFRVSGQIPRFENPVKYRCNFRINLNRRLPRRWLSRSTVFFLYLSKRYRDTMLSFLVMHLCYIVSKSKNCVRMRAIASKVLTSSHIRTLPAGRAYARPAAVSVRLPANGRNWQGLVAVRHADGAAVDHEANPDREQELGGAYDNQNRQYIQLIT